MAMEEFPVIQLLVKTICLALIEPVGYIPIPNSIVVHKTKPGRIALSE
jgi:hypothetical protein